jgi:4-amino-4-deoxy-L-arabinose transferase-like glycosyltransferase
VPGGLILAVALIQLAHLVYFEPFTGTYGDTAGYVSLADAILTWPAFGIFYQPLYPAFLKFAALLTDPEHFRRFVVLAQIAMVVATSILVYSIVIRLSDSRWLAWAAALLLALDIRITIYEYLALTEIAAIFFSVLFIYASFRALVDNSRGWGWLAALSLFALALTKFSYVSLVFVAGAVSALLAWRLRNAAAFSSLRRYALALCVVGALLAAKIATCYHYTGAVSAHTGAVLMAFLNLNPEMVLRLPDGDPDLAKVKAFYARNGTLLNATDRSGGPIGSAHSSRAALRIYTAAVLGHPVWAVGAALKEYYWQNSQNVLFCYPEETNFREFESSRNVLLAVERGINRTFFESWQSVALSTLCLLLGTLLLFTSMPAGQKVMLGLLLAFTFYTVFVSTWMFGGFWIADNSRMRLMYETPLIALWFFVPHRLITLRRRFDTTAP